MAGIVSPTSYFHNGPDGKSIQLCVSCLSHLRTPRQGDSMDMNEPLNFICRHCDVDFTRCFQVILFLVSPNQCIA